LNYGRGATRDRSGKQTIEVAIQKRLDKFLLDVNLGEEGFVCLSGRNGSGKTSFMKVVAGLMRPDEGHVWINGIEVTEWPMERRRVVMVTPDSALPNLEVDAHLLWGAKLRRKRIDQGRLERTKEDLGIDFQGNVGKLSMGMRERVALATALLAAPSAILVDEAFANLHEKEQFISSYRKLAAESRIDVIFSTQDDSDGKMADHLYLMEQGKAMKRF